MGKRPYRIYPQGSALVEPGARAYKLGECLVIVGHSKLGWHLSISHPRRYPTWDEIKAARYQLTPHQVTMAFILPPPEEYVNVDPTCFHLWEIEQPKDSTIVIAQ